jgi:hypothetical protein
MRFFKTRFLALCGSMVLIAAALAPVAASCPDGVVNCGGSKTCICAGTQQGSNCVYDAGCVNGGCCKSEDLLLE